MLVIFLVHGRAITRALALLLLFALGLGYAVNWATGGRVLGYLKKSGDSKEMVGVHLFISILLAFLLPNHVLVKLDFFNTLFRTDETWVAITMLAVFTISFVDVGLAFSAVSKSKEGP